MVGTWTGQESRRLRHALRLTVRAFAEDLGVSPRTISKWEQAGASLTPRPELQAALDTMLARASTEEQRRFAGAGNKPIVPSLQGIPPDINLGAALASSAADAAAFAVWWETRAAGPFGVDTVFSELTRLSRDYLDGPPEPIVVALGNVRQLIFELLRQPQSPGQARDLHLAAGYVCVLLSWLGGDFGQLGAADTHARAGALFAETSGSTELGAWVQAARSKTLFWAGDYRRAAEVASAGSTTAPPTGVRVLLAAQAADAYATLGAH
jgi:transcriptional regulator with XRE-family HTH domain